jgi:hypothetical protein
MVPGTRTCSRADDVHDLVDSELGNMYMILLIYVRVLEFALPSMYTLHK